MGSRPTPSPEPLAQARGFFCCSSEPGRLELPLVSSASSVVKGFLDVTRIIPCCVQHGHQVRRPQSCALLLRVGEYARIPGCTTECNRSAIVHRSEGADVGSTVVARAHRCDCCGSIGPRSNRLASAAGGSTPSPGPVRRVTKHGPRAASTRIRGSRAAGRRG